MIKNYVLAAVRRSFRNRVFSLVNIFGLTIGMAAFIFIFQYIKFEESYDKFRANLDNLYRVFTRVYESGQMTSEGIWCGSALGPALKADFPEIRESARILPIYLNIVSYKVTKITEPVYYMADAAFLKIFSVRMTAGDAGAVL